jgi:uncharacterized protein
VRLFRIVLEARSRNSGLMLESPWARALTIAGTFVLAGFVKGVTGMGLPTVAMGVLGTLMPPVSAAALLLVPSFATNAWQLSTGGRLAALAARLWSMMCGIAVGTLVGTWLLTHGQTPHATMALGVALMIYAAISLLAWRPSIPPHLEPHLSPAVGLVTGLITGATGLFTVPAVPYLQALDLGKDEFVQALGLSFMVSTVALAGALAGGNALHHENISASILATIPALAGVWIGQRVRVRVSPSAFRRWFLLALLCLGLGLSLR